jgi:hypothetical protein
MKGFREYEFDLPSALLARLVEMFDSMESGPLNESALEELPEEQGVYQLFLNGEICYVGKTDADAGLRKRLIRHAHKMEHRVGLDPSLINFRAIRLYVFTAMDLESQLLKYYKKTNGKSVAWNKSGFGANDPGRQRDTTTYKEGHFERLFPIDIDRTLPGLDLSSASTAAHYLQLLKDYLPYTLRFEGLAKNPRKTHVDLEQAVSLSKHASLTTRSLITDIVGQLEPGWQAVKLPSHVILYKEDKVYASGEVLIRSG